jgi:hypothetical protein
MCCGVECPIIVIQSIVNTSDLDESTSIYYFAGKDYKPDVSRRGNEDALQQLIDEGRRLGLAAHSPTKQQRSKVCMCTVR